MKANREVSLLFLCQNINKQEGRRGTLYIQNPYMQQQIIRVTGEPGARAYNMQPCSSALLLDETAPIVWLAQTDSAGYKTLTPYTIEKYTPKPEPDINEIMDRLTRLEERINESYIADIEQRKQPAAKQCNQQTRERKEPQRAIPGPDAE